MHPLRCDLFLAAASLCDPLVVALREQTLYPAQSTLPRVPLPLSPLPSPIYSPNRQVLEANFGPGARGRGRGRGGRGGGRGAFLSGPPPPGYKCNRCGLEGHWIQACPTNGDPDFEGRRARAPVGIPMERLAPSEGGGLLLPSGATATLVAQECGHSHFKHIVGCACVHVCACSQMTDDFALVTVADFDSRLVVSHAY